MISHTCYPGSIYTHLGSPRDGDDAVKGNVCGAETVHENIEGLYPDNYGAVDFAWLVAVEGTVCSSKLGEITVKVDGRFVDELAIPVDESSFELLG